MMKRFIMKIGRCPIKACKRDQVNPRVPAVIIEKPCRPSRERLEHVQSVEEQLEGGEVGQRVQFATEDN